MNTCKSVRGWVHACQNAHPCPPGSVRSWWAAVSPLPATHPAGRTAPSARRTATQRATVPGHPPRSPHPDAQVPAAVAAWLASKTPLRGLRPEAALLRPHGELAGTHAARGAPAQSASASQVAGGGRSAGAWSTHAPHPTARPGRPAACCSPGPRKQQCTASEPRSSAAAPNQLGQVWPLQGHRPSFLPLELSVSQ
jgi:hypothetical protein